MDKLKDEIHNCDKCDIYPCSLQEEVSKGDICRDCPTPCCRSVMVVLLPCEKVVLKQDEYGGLKMKDDGWCFYFDKDKGWCSIYDNRPVTCRIASCRFIREGKIPDEIKIIKKQILLSTESKKLSNSLVGISER